LSDSIGSLRKQIASAGDLQSVVRTMKTLAASSIGQYEKSTRALGDYFRTVELGLAACLHSAETEAPVRPKDQSGDFGVVVFGSDQGLVGQFNDLVAQFAIKTLAEMPGNPQVWAVGERVSERLSDARLPMMGLFPVPNSVEGITALIGRIQVEIESHREKHGYERVVVIHNRTQSAGLYEPVTQNLLPLDETWKAQYATMPWPSRNVAEVVCGRNATLAALIREYLFISLYRACAESLASENASRLAAMERADRNIDELIKSMQGTFHRLRQSVIDEELFDVISGFEALSAHQ
jgi:F-type H+-transporting ATPase subunit gamma